MFHELNHTLAPLAYLFLMGMLMKIDIVLCSIRDIHKTKED